MPTLGERYVKVIPNALFNANYNADEADENKDENLRDIDWEVDLAILIEGRSYHLGLNKAPIDDYITFIKPENWLSYLNSEGTLLLDIILPAGEEAKWDEDLEKYTANNIIVLNVRKITDMEEWEEPQFCLETIQKSKHALKFIKPEYQTDDICLSAVRRNGLALRYVREDLKTPELCLAAVSNEGNSLRYVRDDLKTPELCLAAVQQNGYMLEFVPVGLQTEEMCLIAVRQDKSLLRNVREEFKDVCKAAIDAMREAIEV